ncbi:mitochondrial enolase superfamily member 1 [Grus japonensis]|uniref:Mitochondrial enolase superfamily member 1 n=1 Tax=Grus japonensis TaxID=30415 RepID=A0ABC9Y5A7_GRUJA
MLVVVQVALVKKGPQREELHTMCPHPRCLTSSVCGAKSQLRDKEMQKEKVELLNAFFALVFTAKAGPQESQTLEAGEKVWRKEDLPLVEEDRVREHLGKLNIHKSMGPDGMHPQVLRELADVIARSLSIIFERSWRTGEVPEDWRKANVTLLSKKGKKEDPGNYRPVSLTSNPGKVMEQLILGVINKHVEEKKVIGGDQHGFNKGKSC